MYGLPACYWLLDQGEEKESEHWLKKNRERKANNEIKKSINLLRCALCALGLLSSLSVDAKGRDLMTPSGEPSQHDPVTFALYSILAAQESCGELMSQSDLL